ncbi:hypothetical protein [Synechococcus sp. PCC 7336]|uniref:DUF6916 family protein n=1 Tax=Synechococcus sp. PCC 7336 TaxID=195250 RepID=UPI00034D7E32|nr:hypothetical protein [Synechococcus sp. PCC 7336]
MLKELTREDFSDCLKEKFSLALDDRPPLEFELIDVSDLPSRPTSGGSSANLRSQPFSLLFLGPSEPLLDQQIYRLQHDRIGAADIFLVPVGADAEGVEYEAVFT